MHKQRIAILSCAVLGIISPYLPWKNSFALMDTFIYSSLGWLIIGLFVIIGLLSLVKDKDTQLTTGLKIAIIITTIFTIICCISVNFAFSSFDLSFSIMNAALTGDMMNISTLPSNSHSSGLGFYLSLFSGIGTIVFLLILKDKSPRHRIE